MINTRIVIGMLMLFSTAVLAASQTPQNPSQQTAPQQTAPRPSPQPPAPTAMAGQTTTTLAGCLYREAQVPGRTPNVAERAGVLEDYILADATAPPGATPGVIGTSGTVPTSGNMYKVESISDERLKALVGKRVEVTGRIDPEGPSVPGRPGAATGAPTPDRGLGPDQINLPEFEASSIREIAGTCPATPAPRK